jgi:hypothetical protein
VIASAANAAGLGKLVVLSAMGEPFRAEIDLLSDPAQFPDTRTTLTPRLASPDSYPQAGFRYNAALTGTRLNIRPSNGRQVIDVASERPLNEPFVYLLVEIESNATRIVRGYTALLDPPGYRAPQVAAAAEYLPVAVAVTVAAPAVKPAAARALVADPVKAVARPAPRQERLSDADAKTLASMLERVAALEAAVAQLQVKWEKPDVVVAETSPARNTPAVKVSPPPLPPATQPVPAAPVEPMRRASNQDSLLNIALLVLAIGLLILLGGLAYVLWGRPVVRERLTKAKG